MTIIQKPNLPLILAIAGLIVGKLTEGVFQATGNTLYTIAIIIWAYLELSSGVNTFRRLLGAAILAYTAYSLFGAFR